MKGSHEQNKNPIDWEAIYAKKEELSKLIGNKRGARYDSVPVLFTREQDIERRKKQILELNPEIPEERDKIERFQHIIEVATREVEEEKQDKIKQDELWSELEESYQDADFIKSVISEQDSHRIEKKSFLEPSASFHEVFKESGSPQVQFITDFIKEKPILNLGSGIDTFLARHLRQHGISKYSGVDLLNPANHESNAEGQVIGEFEGTNFFQDDMLNYISNQPNASTNIMLNGIDTSIVTSYKYAVLLAMHIARVVPEGGVVMGVASEAVFPYLEKLGFVRLLSKQEGFSFELYVKK